MVEQWNRFERQLPFLLTLEVNYVGIGALNLPIISAKHRAALAGGRRDPGNNALATSWQSRFPHWHFSAESDDVGRSSYKSLQVSVSSPIHTTRLAILSN